MAGGTGTQLTLEEHKERQRSLMVKAFALQCVSSRARQWFAESAPVGCTRPLLLGSDGESIDRDECLILGARGDPARRDKTHEPGIAHP